MSPRAGLAWVARSLGVGALFALAVAVSSLLHVGTPTGRDLVTVVANDLLGGLFRGKIVLERVASLGPRRLDGVDVRIVSEAGESLVEARGVSAKLDGPALASAALFGRGPLAVRVEAIEIDHADVSVARGPSGALALAEAFAPKKPAASASPTGAAAPTVHLASIHMHHAWVHGSVAEGVAVDADVERVRATLRSTADGVAVTLDDGSVVARGAARVGAFGAAHATGASLALRLRGALHVPPEADKSPRANVAFVGALAELPLFGSASLREGDLRASLTLPTTPGEKLRAVVPAVEVHGPVSLRANARLQGSRLRLVAHVGAGKGELAAYAEVVLPAGLSAKQGTQESGDVHIAAGVQASAFELATFTAPGSAPPSRLGLDAVAHLTVSKEGPRSGELSATLAPGSHVASIGLPPSKVTATLDAARRLVADLVALEPGVATHAHAELSPSQPLVFSSSSTLDLGALTRAELVGSAKGGLGRGTGSLHTKGTLDLGTLALDAHAEATLGGLDTAGVRVRELHLGVDAGGPLRAATLHVTASGSGLRFGARAPRGSSKGRPDGLGVDFASTSAVIALGETLTIRDGRILARTAAETVQVSVPSAHVDKGSFELTAAEVLGLGAPAHASVSRRGGRTTAHVRCDDLDLGRIARLIGLAGLAGHVRVDTEATSTGKELDGYARVELVRGSVPGYERASGSVDATLAARSARVNATVDLGEGLRLEANGLRVSLAGPALEPSSWLHADAVGSLEANVDLAQAPLLARLAGLPALPVTAGGHAQLRASFTHGRDASEIGLPSVDLALATRGLTVAATASTPAIAGADVYAELHVDGVTGFSAVSTRLVDARGVLLEADVKGRAPLADLVAGAPRDRVWQAWLREPVGARIAMPRRKLSELPAFLGLAGIAGLGSLELHVDGTPGSPTVRLEGAASELRGRGATAATALATTLTYDGHLAKLTALATAGTGKAHLEASLESEIAELLAGKRPADLAWTAGGAVLFEGFPLAALPVDGGREARLGGRLDGRLALVGLHRDASLEVDLRTRDATVGAAAVPHTSLHGKIASSRAALDVKVEQADGFADLRATASSVAWGARLVPELDRASAVDAKLSARAFRLSVLSPFTTRLLGDLDGRLDADAHVSTDGDGKNLQSSGTITAQGVAFVLVPLGQEYRDVGAKLTFEPGGVVKIDDIRATEGSGKLAARITARFHGLDFVGANASVRIPKSHPLDLVADGQALGDAYGDLGVSVTNDRARKTLAIAVDVPSLHMKLAESAGRSVQGLRARADINVGVVRDGKLQRVALGKAKLVDPDTSPAETLDVTVKLGNDVELRRGSMLAAQLTGTPSVRIANGKTTVSGQIQLVAGSIDIQGKKFVVEKGTLTFGADPTNPVVLATASWIARDKTRVIAEFVGPVQTGKLSLRSEPSHSQTDIFSLIVFGTTDGVTATQGRKQSTGTQAATAIGGGALTQGFDSALDDVTGLSTQTRIDTTNSNNPRPELEIQISRDVSLRFAYVLGTPPQSEPDKSLATVIYRFAPNWSVSSTVGDRGKATLDTVWQYRY